MIELTELTKYYGNHRGIEGVNLTVPKGALFGFIGPNGAGKSTTIRTLMGLLKPTSGQGLVFGQDMVKHGQAIRKRIGYLPSEVAYYERMNSRDLLEYSGRFYGKVDQDRLKYLIDWFDLDATKSVEDLSFGNRKKVGIIQALLHRPELLILDEPTTGLDPLMQARFFQLLKEENKAGTTVFFSSHTLSEVQQFCETVAVIREGEILEVSPVDELRKKHLKQVTVRLATGGQSTQTQGNDLEGLQDVIDLHQEGHKITFQYAGQLQALFSKLASLDIDDFSMAEPSLEDIFMHYYETGEEV